MLETCKLCVLSQTGLFSDRADRSDMLQPYYLPVLVRPAMVFEIWLMMMIWFNLIWSDQDFIWSDTSYDTWYSLTWSDVCSANSWIRFQQANLLHMVCRQMMEHRPHIAVLVWRRHSVSVTALSSNFSNITSNSFSPLASCYLSLSDVILHFPPIHEKGHKLILTSCSLSLSSHSVTVALCFPPFTWTWIQTGLHQYFSNCMYICVTLWVALQFLPIIWGRIVFLTLFSFGDIKFFNLMWQFFIGLTWVFLSTHLKHLWWLSTEKFARM